MKQNLDWQAVAAWNLFAGTKLGLAGVVTVFQEQGRFHLRNPAYKMQFKFQKKNKRQKYLDGHIYNTKAPAIKTSSHMIKMADPTMLEMNV